MEALLRKTGISVVGDVPWGTHFCHFYDTKQDLLDTLVPYFKAGLESKEYCLWVICDPLIQEEAKRALKRVVPDLDEHLMNKNIEILDGLRWYLNENVFNLERVATAWDRKLEQALARGYAGMRVSGDTFWLRERDWKDFSAYEKQLNESITDRPMTVLCTYPLAKSRAAEVLDVVQTHQVAIARQRGEWKVIETPQLIEAKSEIKRLNEKLEQRVIERTIELRMANEELRKEIAERKAAEEKLKVTTEQLRALSARLQSAREEEGTRIAREIHDELGSALTSLRWDLEGIAKIFSDSEALSPVPDLRTRIAAMLGLTDTTFNIVRKIASDLRPSVLDVLGLREAIEWQSRQFRDRTGIVVHCHSTLDDVHLDQEQSTAVFRIFQEALTNILRHAKATRVDVTMAEEAGAFVLVIRDNGRGITEGEKSGPLSIGLLGMRERAHLIGGEVDIVGVEGEGTAVTVRLPLFASAVHWNAATD